MITRDKRFILLVVQFVFVIVSLFLAGCKGGTTDRYEALKEIDTLLLENPRKAMDQLIEMPTSSFSSHEKAYYGLLWTIARHKNHIKFSDDSLIKAAKEWYEHDNKNMYNLARAVFYHGLVLLDVGTDKSQVLQNMLQAKQSIDREGIKDERLYALICAYLAQLNDTFVGDYAEAAMYYRQALDYEHNPRNRAIDYCGLLVCLVKSGQLQSARQVLIDLNVFLSDHPEVKFEKINNAKAIYYLYAVSELDSAWKYTSAWKPPQLDYGAKMGMLSEIAERKEMIDSAIFFEKKAFDYRRVQDTLFHYVYYKRLSELFEKQSEAESTALYARMAYQGLRKNLDQLSNKKILELEKQYDVAAKEQEVERIRYNKNILFIGLLVSLLISALLISVIALRQLQLKALEKVVKTEQELKDQLQKQHQTEIEAANKVLSAEKQMRKILFELSKNRNLTIDKLTPILNKAYGERASVAKDLEILIGALKGDQAMKVTDILEAEMMHQKPIIRRVSEKISGKQMQAVFILTELGCTTAEIKEYISTSAASVRATKSNLRKWIQESEFANVEEIQALRIMQEKYDRDSFDGQV